MKKSKGMTLVELLIAMGVSVMIMASTFVIVNFSASAYDDTVLSVTKSNNTGDAVNIINRYIRTSFFCSLSEDNKSLYVTLSAEDFGGDESGKHTVLLAFDADSKTLYIDRLDGTNKLIVSKNISDMEWEITDGGVKYKATNENTGKTAFSGFTYIRGR